MKRSLLAILVVMCALPIAAFAADTPADDEASFQKAVAPVVDNLFAGVKAHDYVRMTRDFSAKMKSEVLPEKLEASFASVEKNFGEFVSHSFSKMEKSPPYVLLYYGMKFSKGGETIMQIAFKDDDSAHKIQGFFLRPAETPKRVTKEEADAILKEVKPVIDDYFAAFKAKDYARMTKNFGDDFRKALPPDKLKEELDKAALTVDGPFVSAEFDRVETDKLFNVVIYAAKYGANSKTEVKFVFQKGDATHKLVGLWERPI